MVDWELISYITSSTIRFKILIELNKKQNIPSRLAKSLNIPISHISKTLTELESHQLVNCLTPNRRKGKFFSITNKGKDILKQINKITL
ncbi:MAG: winged helix-turn-helix domain-containing protein [Promethearchaeia archaeon]